MGILDWLTSGDGSTEGACHEEGGGDDDDAEESGYVGAGVDGADHLRDQSDEDHRKPQADVGGGEEGGHCLGTVGGLGQPDDLAQAAPEDQADRDTADDGPRQEEPQRLGEERSLQGGETNQ